MCCCSCAPNTTHCFDLSPRFRFVFFYYYDYDYYSYSCICVHASRISVSRIGHIHNPEWYFITNTIIRRDDKNIRCTVETHAIWRLRIAFAIVCALNWVPTLLIAAFMRALYCRRIVHSVGYTILCVYTQTCRPLCAPDMAPQKNKNMVLCICTRRQCYVVVVPGSLLLTTELFLMHRQKVCDTFILHTIMYTVQQ